MIYARMRVVFLLPCFAVFFTAVAPADEPFGVRLMRPDSLAGWDYGRQPPTGWTIAEGRLSGKGDSTPLLSGFSAGRFELRFQWSVADGGALKISLPEVPNGKGLEIVLREGDRCGRLTDGDKELAPGEKVEPPKDKMHTAAIRRAGEKLSLTVDGKRLYEVDVQPGRRFGLGLAVVGGEATLAYLRGEEPLGEPIFNGKDLAGWWCPGNIEAWKADANELVLDKRGGNYIRTEKEYGNFTLVLEYMMRKGGNSGIGVRTPRNGWPSGDGMELQLEDRPGLHKGSTMAIYGNLPPLARADKSEQWNHVVVKADGWMISVWCNGELVQHCNTLQHPELKHRNLNGWIGFQDHGAWIRVREIRLLEAPDGTGLDAWQKPRPPRATTSMIDRLMNPERLSAIDGITSGVVSKTVAAAGEGQHVLAELTGPGAVVRIARSNDEGRLAFYFDGEDNPRIECRPNELRGALPPVADERNPVTTCLTYRKGLEVILRDAGQADYRFDYVTFPRECKLETFTDPHCGFPPGWLAAAEYRHGQNDWGVHREHEPIPRFESEKKTIEPGKTEQLLHVEGAGIVRWIKLRADRSPLQNNDLWLEVTIDGEGSPAISAPARYLFPGLVAAGRYHNFVLTDRGGPTARLAMPYADGITFSAKNCGRQPIQGVGLMISVDRATDATREDIVKRMRLRGIFRPAQDGDSELINQEGWGRWVAWTYQQPEGEQTGVAELIVDGKPADGWAAANLDLFLGQQGDFRKCLSGRQQGLCWRYLYLAPVEFQKSFLLKAAANKVGNRLALFYLKK